MMLSHLELPQERYLEQLYHVLAYLNKCHKSDLVLDPSYQVIDQAEF